MLATRNSKKVQTSSAGHGPLWQRDYWVALDTSTLAPEEIALLMRSEFPVLSPAELAEFTPLGNASTPLEVGDEMKVEIRGAGTSEVRVIHCDAHSLTVRTLDGHLEAGRISFGAYLEDGKTIIRVRSRARSASLRRHVAYLILGHGVQAKVWEIFVSRVAARCGLKEIEVQRETRRAKSTLADLGEIDTPTFPTENR